MTFRSWGQSATDEQLPVTVVPPDATASPISSAPNPYSDVLVTPPPAGATAPTAGTAGVSTASGTSAPVFQNPLFISQAVSVNPFQPPDLITSDTAVPLASLRNNQAWDLSFLSTDSLNYDSNVTRTSGGNEVGEGYLHASAGLDFRAGTLADVFAFDLLYNYSADLFNHHTEFDTYTHDFSFSGRIGRSNLVLVPYVVGRFRSVEDQAAADSDRQSYGYLIEGVHVNTICFPNLIHVCDFSHTSVSYPARIASNFEIWDLSQQLAYTISTGRSAQFLQTAQLFPWLQVRETSRQALSSVDEINGGMGGKIAFDDDFSLRAQIGWGDVSGAGNSIDYGRYSGLRYDISASWKPSRLLVLTADCRRAVTFNPTVATRVTDQADITIAFPLQPDVHWTVTPAFGLYRASSDDYTFPESSLYLQPSLTVAYKLNDHAGAFAKIQYSDNIDNQLGTTNYTPDLQCSLGVNVLF